MVRHIQGSQSTKHVQGEIITLRNSDGTYRTMNNNNQKYGNPVELDASRKWSRFNLSRKEFQRRIREQLCPKSAQPGHLARNCTRNDEPKPFNAQNRVWQTTKKPAPWQTRPKMKEIEVEQEPEHLGNDKCPGKRWSEGQTPTEIHHSGKLLYGTQLHRYTRMGQWLYHGKNRITRRKIVSYYLRHDWLRSNRRLHQPRSL